MNDDLDLKQNNNFEGDFSDGLLNDLQELDDITDDMQEIVGSVKESKKSIQHTSSPATIDSATVSLEAAKISQASAENSQQAIEAAIKLSHEQKKQTIELSDSTIAWRNSVSKANKAIASSKSTMAIMLTASIIVSLIAMGVVGYLYYSLNKKNELMKGEVLDIIATELSLSGKKNQLKLDQLASLFESLNARALAQNIPAPVIAEKPVSQPQKVQALDTPIKLTTENPTITIDNSEIKKQLHTYNQQTNKYQKQQTNIIKALQADIQQNQTMLSALTTLVQSTKEQIKTSVKSNIKTPVEVIKPGLTDAQLKKIKNISWAVHKQGKVLKEIQRMIANKSDNSTQLNGINKLLNGLKKQTHHLQQQQLETQHKLENMQLEIKKTNSKTRPYRYQSRD